MSLSVLVTALYGLLAIAGGLFGYRQSDSRASLIAGSLSGALLLLGAGLMLGVPAAAAVAFWGSLTVVLLLVVVFAVRLQKTRKLMPAGLMLGLGLVSAGLMLFDQLR